MLPWCDGEGVPGHTLELLHYSCQTVKTKEEKEVLEHFAGVVS